MEGEQTINYYPMDKKIERNLDDHFSIYGDMGSLFQPGKTEKSKKFRCLYCQSNCGAEFMVGKKRIPLQRGDILVIRPEIFHGFVTYTKTEESYAGYMVEISEDFIEYLMLYKEFTKLVVWEEFLMIHTRGTLWERIDTLFLMTLEEERLKMPGWKTALFGSSIMLLVQMTRAAHQDPAFSVKTEKQELAKTIQAYVESNLAEKISLEDVANRFFVSASTVTHLFQNQVGISFYKYVMQRRLWKAQNLIREGMPMEKIAANVGFNDYSSFYRAFKQEYGKSPRQYLKEIGEK